MPRTYNKKPETKKPAKKRGRGRPKQQRLGSSEEGFGGERFPDVNKAAEKYVETRDQRQAWLSEEVDARRDLVAAMNAHGLHVYRDPDSDLLVTIIEGVTKVKVTKVDEVDEEDGGDL